MSPLPRAQLRALTHFLHVCREQKVEVTIHTLRNGVVRVEDAEENLYAAIDLVCDKIERKLTRTKEKAIAKGRW
jgi:putative sigma-54 modulation protein